MMTIDGRAFDLDQLSQELLAAQVPFNYLGADAIPGTDPQAYTNLHTYDEAGASIPLPPEADPIVAAHAPKGEQIAARQARIDAEAEAQAQLLALSNPDYLVLLAGGSVGSHAR